MSRRRSSAGLSPLVAVILLIAITVAAAVVVAGVFFNLSSIAGRRPTAIIDQVKLVVNTAGDGTWAFVIKNIGDVPIAKMAADFPTGCSPGSPTYSGPVNPGQTFAAYETVSGSCQIGQTYTLVLRVIFDDGSEQILLTQTTGSIA
ncbi:MAG: archaellin/type IV pilin N-terminal domain-containing protein [Candidatus Caldarchaeum sp.]